LDVLGLQVPTRDLRDSPCYHVCPSFNTFPSEKCSTTGNSLCIDFDIFWKQIITHSRLFRYCIVRVVRNYIYFFLLFVSYVTLYWTLLFVFVHCAAFVMSHLAKG
jgi:hypothetical protein